MSRRSTTHSCILCGFCNERKEGNKVSYFNFPQDEALRKKWTLACKLPDGVDVSSSRLCSNHFITDDFTNSNNATAKRIRLKKWVIPSRFPHQSSKVANEGVISTEKSSYQRRYCQVCRQKTAERTRRLPKDDATAKEWLKFFCLPEGVRNLKDARFCVTHFQETDFDKHEGTIHRRTVPVAPLSSEMSDFNVNENMEQIVCEPSIASHDELLMETSEISLLQSIDDLPMETAANYAHSPVVEMVGSPLVESPDNLSIEPVANSRDTPAVEMVENSMVEVEPDEDVLMEPSPHSSLKGVEEPTVETVENSAVLTRAPEIPATPTTGNQLRDKNATRGRLIFPRYPNDIRTPHISTPRSARRCLQITKDVIEKQKTELRSVKQQLRRARQKIKNLEQILEHLEKESLLNADMTESLMVGTKLGIA